VIQILKDKGLVTTGDIVVNTASMPLAERARTNLVKFSVVK
jgi:pyruvate kinase